MFESIFSLLSSRQDGIAPKGSPSGNESGDGDAFHALYANRDSAETTRDPSASDATAVLFGAVPLANQPIISELSATLNAVAGARPAQQHRLAVIEAHDLIGGEGNQTLFTRAHTPILSQPTSLQSTPMLTGVDLQLDTLSAIANRTPNSAIVASPGAEATIGISDALPDTIETLQVSKPKHAAPQIWPSGTGHTAPSHGPQTSAIFSDAAGPKEDVQASTAPETLKSANSAAISDTIAADAKIDLPQAAQNTDEMIITPHAEQRDKNQSSGVPISGAPGPIDTLTTAAKSGDAASKRAKNTATADATLTASAQTGSQATLTSLDPISKLATTVLDASGDLASPASTLGSTTSGSTALNLTSTTVPSFNPAAPTGQNPVIVASPADVPNVVAQALAQNESTERIAIQLDPPELGRVSIEFQIDESGVHTVTITSETSEALRKLRLMNFELLQALEQQGLGGRSFSLEYQHSEQAEHWAQSSDDHGDDGDDTQTSDAAPSWPKESLHATRLSDPSQLGASGLNLRL